MTGVIFDIQKFSIHDGPGIRTTVFLKGCPLRCLWCHNPESFAREHQISFARERCTGCGACAQHCPRQAHRLAAGAHTFDRGTCAVCGRCAGACHAGALALVGRTVTVADVLGEVLKDKPFYEASGGGLTLSGGEPLAQPDFAAALLEDAGRAGLHRCVETSGFAPPDVIGRLRPLTDLFLFDIKETDPARHREYTGVPLQPILDSLAALHAAGARIRLRLPVVPGYNDRPAHRAAVAGLWRRLPGLEGIELLPFNPLGEGKRTRLGLERRAAFDPPMPEPQTVARWAQDLRSAGVNVLNESEIACASA